MLGGSRSPLRMAELHLAWIAMQKSKSSGNGKSPHFRFYGNRVRRVRRKLAGQKNSTRLVVIRSQ
jgi:hypothetical protein